MTREEIAVVVITCFWFVVAIALYFVTRKLAIEDEYKKFYPHPTVQVYKSMKYDPQFGRASTITFTILYTILYLPITVEWFICWCVWKLMKLFVDSYVEINTIETIEKPVVEDEPVVPKETNEQEERVETELYNEMPEDISNDVQGQNTDVVN